MATSGSATVNATWTSGGNVGDYIYFSWKRTGYSIAGNYSDITWSMVLYSNSAGYISSSASKSWSVTVNGSSYSGTNTVGIGSNTSKTLASGSTRIYHAANGTKSFSYSFSQQFNITFNSWVGTVSGSGSSTLDTIPRYAAITSFKSTSISQTSIGCSWSTDASCNGVEYRLDGIVKSTSSTTSSSGSYTFSGLSPNTAYRIKVRVKRADSGLWTDSSELSYTTPPIASITTTDFSFVIGTNLTLNFKDQDRNASTLKLRVQGDSGAWVENVTTTVVPLNTASYVWNLSSVANTLYGHCKTKNTLNFEILCGTTLNGVFFSKSYSGIAKVANSNPTFTSYNFLNTQTALTTFLGMTNASIQGDGNFQIQIPAASKAAAKNQATITKYIASMTLPNAPSSIIKSQDAAYSSSAQVNIDLGRYETPGNYDIYVKAIDSRGNASASVKKTCVILPYHIPNPTITMWRVNNFEKEVLLNISILFSRLLVGSVAKNTLRSISYRYAEVGQPLPAAYTPITGYTTSVEDTNNAKAVYAKASAASPFLSLPIEKSYTFEFLIEDALYKKKETVSVVQGIPIMGEFDNGYVTVGKLPDFNNALFQVNSDIQAKDGQGVLRNIFATISSLFTLSSTEPSNQIVGGIWLEDVTDTYTK